MQDQDRYGYKNEKWPAFEKLITMVIMGFNQKCKRTQHQILPEVIWRGDEWDCDFRSPDQNKLIGNMGMAVWDPPDYISLKLCLGIYARHGDALVRKIGRHSGEIINFIRQLSSAKDFGFYPKRRYVPKSSSGRPIQRMLYPYEEGIKSWDEGKLAPQDELDRILKTVVSFHRKDATKAEIANRSDKGGEQVSRLSFNEYFQFGCLLITYELSFDEIIKEQWSFREITEDLVGVAVDFNSLLRFLSD